MIIDTLESWTARSKEESPLIPLQSRVIYRGSYERYRDELATVFDTSSNHSRSTHVWIEFDDGVKMNVLRSILEVLAD